MNEAKLQEGLREAYDLLVAQVMPLGLGADPNADTYKVTTDDGQTYFLKAKRGPFDDLALEITYYLRGQGIVEVIAPIATRHNSLVSYLDDDNILILYPFVEGANAFEKHLSDSQWVQLGRTLRHIHSLVLPPSLQTLPQESYSPRWRESVRVFLARALTESFDEPTAAKLVELLRTHQDAIEELLHRAERLEAVLSTQAHEHVLCHADLHAWNVLVGNDDTLYIVDWDNPILAAKERDLMFIRSGIGGIWNTERETSLFYEGYGDVEIHRTALSYYRYERIVEDIAVACEQVFSTVTETEDKETELRNLTGQFLPGSLVEFTLTTNDPA